jgi:hypothetical protein
MIIIINKKSELDARALYDKANLVAVMHSAGRTD